MTMTGPNNKPIEQKYQLNLKPLGEQNQQQRKSILGKIQDTFYWALGIGTNNVDEGAIQAAILGRPQSFPAELRKIIKENLTKQKDEESAIQVHSDLSKALNVHYINPLFFPILKDLLQSSQQRIAFFDSHSDIEANNPPTDIHSNSINFNVEITDQIKRLFESHILKNFQFDSQKSNDILSMQTLLESVSSNGSNSVANRQPSELIDGNQHKDVAKQYLKLLLSDTLINKVPTRFQGHKIDFDRDGLIDLRNNFANQGYDHLSNEDILSSIEIISQMYLDAEFQINDINKKITEESSRIEVLSDSDSVSGSSHSSLKTVREQVFPISDGSVVAPADIYFEFGDDDQHSQHSSDSVNISSIHSDSSHSIPGEATVVNHDENVNNDENDEETVTFIDAKSPPSRNKGASVGGMVRSAVVWGLIVLSKTTLSPANFNHRRLDVVPSNDKTSSPANFDFRLFFDAISSSEKTLSPAIINNRRLDASFCETAIGDSQCFGADRSRSVNACENSLSYLSAAGFPQDTTNTPVQASELYGTFVTDSTVASNLDAAKNNAQEVVSNQNCFPVDTTLYDPSAISENIESTTKSNAPSSAPTGEPTPSEPSGQPTGRPSGQPSGQPSGAPTGEPTPSEPSGQPTGRPSGQPSGQPSGAPSGQPTGMPSGAPSGQPSGVPSGQPSGQPSGAPSGQPSGVPSGEPSGQPSGRPTVAPTTSQYPTGQPTTMPTSIPTNSHTPTGQPTTMPSTTPSSQPTTVPSGQPSSVPTTFPSSVPTTFPTTIPTLAPTGQPSTVPSTQPTSVPSSEPSSVPTGIPTTQPTTYPTAIPTLTKAPSSNPTQIPTMVPSGQPTGQPTSQPTGQPTNSPTRADLSESSDPIQDPVEDNVDDSTFSEPVQNTIIGLAGLANVVIEGMTEL